MTEKKKPQTLKVGAQHLVSQCGMNKPASGMKSKFKLPPPQHVCVPVLTVL